MTEAIIEARGLRIGFKVKSGRSFFSAKTKWLWAVDGVDLAIMKGETIGLVGESGCGKTTMAMALLGLEKPSSGKILFKGIDLGDLDAKGLKAYRAAVQAVLQDPWSALSPRSRIGDIVAEPMVVHSKRGRQQHESRVAELLTDVGLEAEHAGRYPHEFSGGQRQRICIARALSVSPELIVLDEPVSALDVSVQAQIINLLKDVQQRSSVSYLLISHSLSTVRFLCTRVAVMYLGQIVELAPTQALFAKPLHPYTQGLLAAASPMRGDDEGRDAVQGEIPSPTELPSGCRFHGRCPKAQDICRKISPVLTHLEDGRQVRCHLY